MIPGSEDTLAIGYGHKQVQDVMLKLIEQDYQKSIILRLKMKCLNNFTICQKLLKIRLKLLKDAFIDPRSKILFCPYTMMIKTKRRN